MSFLRKVFFLRTVRTQVLVGLALTVSIYSLVYILAWKSDAYRSLRDTVFTSHVVEEKIGKPRSIWLVPYGFHIEQSGSFGKAYFKLYVSGENGIGSVFGNVDYERGQWVVTNASVDGVLIVTASY